MLASRVVVGGLDELRRLRSVRGGDAKTAVLEIDGLFVDTMRLHVFGWCEGRHGKLWKMTPNAVLPMGLAILLHAAF
ncbi:hypothetical protein DOTSEDRAFT_73071 [Dothistroma septosporum NZE10]|uniref:Uncharacterized protein n=1 Tax=Dothistroma septosporum (strain NZE10 / CBS 128990) TaxID=675120 RepID=N1PJ80_DOTSN|nr:hypothetical protein DOTSEDRAFT_73071 [Dothistroma septosporum NZE10]